MLSKEVFDALNNPGNSNIKCGTEMVSKALTVLGNPQDKYQVIHITGTNGKGSTAAFIETGLIHAKYKVGKFSSPYIKSINETITFNHSHISDADIEYQYAIIIRELRSHQINLSPFELLTVIMFNYFASLKIHYLVLEVGLGGLNDATNVVNSTISIITNVGLEHTHYLGNSLSDIARAKCGIIKQGITIIADNAPELVLAVKNKTSNYINVLDYYVFTVKLDYKAMKTIVTLSSDRNIFTLGLFGKFQAYNFLCAYHALTSLAVPIASIHYAAENAQHQGRIQVCSNNPLLICDATHNLHGAVALVESLKGLCDPSDTIIITSILGDKDYVSMLYQFSQLSNHIICTSIKDNPRAINHYTLALSAKQYFFHVDSIYNPYAALEYAKSLKKKIVLITGSLYLLENYL